MHPYDTPRTKTCFKCKETKPAHEFPKNNGNRDGLHSYCKICNRQAHQEWRAKNIEHCRERDKKKYWENKEERNRKSREYYRLNREQQILDATRRYVEDKDAAFSTYGGYVCTCCGETERAFLCLDHVNNDGYKHRKEIGRGNIYQWLRLNNYPEGMMQVLCYNCNQGKRINGGVCPHAEDNYQTKLREV